MEIKESIEFKYTWADEKGSETVQQFKTSWDGLTKAHPDCALLHDYLAALLVAIGIDKTNNSEEK